MERRSSVASDDNITSRLLTLILRASGPNKLLDVNFVGLPAVERVNSFLQFPPEMLYALDMGYEILGDALLRRLGQGGHPFYRFLKQLGHRPSIAQRA